jgi:hypothetical protein
LSETEPSPCAQRFEELLELIQCEYSRQIRLGECREDIRWQLERGVANQYDLLAVEAAIQASTHCLRGLRYQLESTRLKLEVEEDEARRRRRSEAGRRAQANGAAKRWAKKYGLTPINLSPGSKAVQ